MMTTSVIKCSVLIYKLRKRYNRINLKDTRDHSIIKFAENSLYEFHISILFIYVVKTKAMHRLVFTAVTRS